MKSFALFILGFLACLLPCAAAPSASLRTEATPREIYIGDPVSVSVIVTVSSDVAATPVVPSTAMGQFELLRVSSPIASIAKDGKITTVYQFFLTTFSTGPLTIPSLPLSFLSADGSKSESKTEEISVNVKSLLAEKGDEGNIRPLKGLFTFKSYLWLWILIGVLLAGALGFWIWKFLKERKELAGVPAGPPRPPEEIAWQAIHALEDADLIHAGQTKEFYYQLSVILRHYLENRYRFSALDRTTHELLLEFRRQSFSAELVALSRDFFDNADLAKFAKYTPTEEEVTDDLNRVKNFINLTTPKKQEATEAEAIPL